MNIWLDDVREAPHGFFRCYSVNQAKALITAFDLLFKGGRPEYEIKLISCDHDMGDYFQDGGDGIELIKWIIEKDIRYPIELHSMNAVGRANMQLLLDGRDNHKEEVNFTPIKGNEYYFRATKDSKPEKVRLNFFDERLQMCYFTFVGTGKYRTAHVKRLSEV